jgi:hypothetical protein
LPLSQDDLKENANEAIVSKFNEVAAKKKHKQIIR